MKKLTLTPESWTIEKTMKEISTRSLKKELGILAELKAKTGKVLQQETVTTVLLLRYKKIFFIILFFLYHLSPTFAYFCISEITNILIIPELL